MFTYKALHNFALRNGGRVITKEITFLKKCKAIRFECGKGHSWEVVTHNALLAPWCPECNGTKTQRNTIEMMQNIAKERGGKCLSKKYVNSESKLEWKCAESHKWEATAHSVKNKKSWCQKCKADKQKNSIEDMQMLAAKKGGKCLSKKYILNNVNLKWQCEKGHRWENQPANITMGQWCPVCNKESEKLTLNEMKKIAKSRGGKCLSKKYIDVKTKLLWECSEGHSWKAIPNLVKHHESWCPVCAGNVKKSLPEIKRIAKQYGGKLLSKKYENNRQKLKWKCSEGHVFHKTLSHVVNRKQWCPTCSKENRQKVAA